MKRKKITDQGVAGLPVAEGRAELLEEIMRMSSITDRPHRPLLVPLAAAAAVIAVAGGAWALTTGDEPTTSPRDQGFGGAPSSSQVETPPEEVETPMGEVESPVGGTPTAPDDDTCIVSYLEGDPVPATDGPEFADCGTVITQEQPSEPILEQERYQRPPRPVLITADGWEVDGVYNMDLDWVGPNGAELHLTWVRTAHPDDPFAYDRYGRAGEEFDVLGETGRLTGFTEEGKDYRVLLTPGVTRDGTSLLIESSSLTGAEFREVIGSLEWVTLDEYQQVIRPAVG